MRKNHIRRLLVFNLVLVVVTGSVPVMAAPEAEAESTVQLQQTGQEIQPEQTEQEIQPEQTVSGPETVSAEEVTESAESVSGEDQVPQEEPAAEKPAEEEPAAGESCYNPVSMNLLPRLRNRGANANDWAYAAIAAVEADLIHDGKADTSIDLSEMHLTYFTHHYNNNGTVDPLGGTEGDHTDITTITGNPVLALQALLNWTGAAKETDYPFETITPAYSISSDDQYNKNAYHVQGAWSIPNSNDEDTEGKRTLIKKIF